MIDRSIRPLFSSNYNNEIQIVCNLLSFDGRDNPDVICINTTSFALYGSSCEWDGPIGCVRVGMINDEFVINPSRKQLENSPLNLVLSVGPNKNIIMIEAWADNLDQNKFIEALEFGSENAYKIVEYIRSVKFEKINNDVKNDNSLLSIPSEDEALDETEPIINSLVTAEIKKFKSTEKGDEEIEKLFEALAYSNLYEILTDYKHDKQSRDNSLNIVKNSVVNSILKSEMSTQKPPGSEYTYNSLCDLFYKFVRKMVRNLALDESKRVDGRSLDELRLIICKSNIYKSLHGSALFQRGQTQVLCSVTFDSPDTMYKSDSISSMMSPSLTNFDKNFMLHYEFPPYATNEISRVGGRADRREIGHGALAEKSVYPVVPNDFPFTIRSFCEVLESNGSSSMASVCASSMALLDAGVDVKEPVCGVAMGIFTEFDKNNENINRYKILTDISGFEDYMGDMDFKISGTKEGITAAQADFKIKGLPVQIIKEIIQESKPARHKIIELMNQEISKPRVNNKSNMPIMKNIEIKVEQRSKMIGIGGVNLKKINAKTGCTINVEDETHFSIFAPNESSLVEAEKLIKSFIEHEREPELEFGGIYKAKIVEIAASGLMVQLYPTMRPTLLPNSQLDGKKIFHGSASEYKVGQEIQVKYFGRDPVDGKMRISRKALFKTTLPAKDLLKK